MDALQGDVDEEIGELHSRVRKLKGVSIKGLLFKLIGFSHNLESCFTLGTDE